MRETRQHPPELGVGRTSYLKCATCPVGGSSRTSRLSNTCDADASNTLDDTPGSSARLLAPLLPRFDRERATTCVSESFRRGNAVCKKNPLALLGPAAPGAPHISSANICIARS